MTAGYLASASNILDLGEYYAFHHALIEAPELYRRMPTPYREPYLAGVLAHALRFGLDEGTRHNREWVLDSTPWNLLIIDRLQEILPDSCCVLVIRDWQGVCESLGRSYEQGYEWAGGSIDDRISLWARFYEEASRIRWPCLAVNYDRLCHDPSAVVAALERELLNLGLWGPFNIANFATSHATGTSARPTIASFDQNGVAYLHPKPKLEENDQHQQATAASIHLALEQTEALQALFPEAFGPSGVQMTR